MNVSSTTALTHEIKQLEALLSTGDPQFLWLKYKILIYFEDWLKIIEVRPGLSEKSEKQKLFM